jgi:hypothetical protein
MCWLQVVGERGAGFDLGYKACCPVPPFISYEDQNAQTAGWMPRMLFAAQLQAQF